MTRDTNVSGTANFVEGQLKAVLRDVFKGEEGAGVSMEAVAQRSGQNLISVARRLLNNRVCLETDGGDLVRFYVSLEGFQGRVRTLDRDRVQDSDYLASLRIKTAKTTADREDAIERVSSARGRIRSMLEVLSRYSIGELPNDVKKTATRSLLRDDCLTFVQFTCPVAAPSKLASQNPEEFIKLSPRESNLFATLPRLVALYKAFEKINVKVKLRLILGDDDEEKYMSEGMNVPDFDSGIFNARVGEYIELLEEMVRTRVPDMDLQITASSRMSQQLRQIRFDYKDLDIDEQALKKEMALTMSLLGKARYENSLTFRKDIASIDEALRRIAMAKFRTYAEQAAQIRSLFPNAILIQNEVPARVREQMFRCAGTKIPLFYPYRLSEPIILD